MESGWVENGFDCPCLRPPNVALLLRGKEHWDNIRRKLEGRKSRAPVTIAMMKLIERNLHKGSRQKETTAKLRTLSEPPDPPHYVLNP